MEIIGIIGLIIAIVGIIYLSFKGLNMVVAAPIAALLIILCNQMNIWGTFIGPEHSYMAGLAGFLIKNFGIFILGAIFGKYMDKSHATVSIADFILSKIGTDSPYKVLVALTLIGAILTFGGISIFVVFFTLIPLARPIFKKLDINWKLLSIPLYLGAGTFTMSMIPGTPSVQNAIPTTVLGTKLTAAPSLGIISTIIMLVFGLWYMKIALKKSQTNGEGFYSYLDEGEKRPDENDEELVKENLPSFTISILPLIVMIATIIFFNNVKNIILIALTFSIVLCAILFRKYLPNQIDVLNAGAIGSIGSSFVAASAVAFGMVLTNAPTFNIVKEFILHIPGPPLVSLAVATSILSGVMAASGSIGTVITQLAPTYLAMGIPAEIIHRIVVIGGGVITVVPQSGVVLTFNTISGLNFKHGFKEAFIVSNGGFLISLIITVIVAQLFYL